MREVLARVERRTAEYAKAPIFDLLRDASVDPGDRLAFFPCFVQLALTLQDACGALGPLGAEAMLRDLETLGHDVPMSLAAAMRLLSSDATAQTRMLGYRIAGATVRAEPPERDVLLWCVEAALDVCHAAARPAADAYALRTGSELASFRRRERTQAAPREQSLPDEERRRLCAMIDELFVAFHGVADELLRFARTSPLRAARARGPAAPSIALRRAEVARASGLDPSFLAYSLDGGGLDVESANGFIENALGVRAFPYAVVPGVRVNGRDYVVPLVAERPDFVRALSDATAAAAGSGGFRASATGSAMIGQIQLVDVADADRAASSIREAAPELLALANAAVPSLVARGGGARRIAVRTIGAPEDRMLVVHVAIDCGNAMGANLVNTVAERIAPRLAELAAAKAGLRILSNLCDERRVVASCRIPLGAMGAAPDRIAHATRLGAIDVCFAVAHNKAVMDALDGVVVATGNDWRAVEAGAHAFASREGRYVPLARWTIEPDAALGEIDVPLALGTVGGTLRAHRSAQLSLRLLGVERAEDLALVAASLALASSYAFLSSIA